MTVRVAVIGAGFMSQVAHIPNFTRAEGCEVVAICDVRERLAKMVAERYHVPRVYRSHEEVADASDVDACVVVVPDELHAPISIDLLKSGKHVFVEKPMATNVRDAREMVRAAERGGAILMVAYMKRYDPGCELARGLISQLVSEGRLGDVTFARAHCFAGEWVCGLSRLMRYVEGEEERPPVEPRPPDWLPPGEYKRFRAFIDVYCHDVNLLRWLVGEPRRVLFAAFARGHCVSVLAYDGFNASLEAGFVRAHFWDEEFKVYFSEGWVEVRPPPPLLVNCPARVAVYEGGEARVLREPWPEWDWSFRREAQHFIDCVRSGEEPRTSGRDSLRDVELIEEIYKTALSLRARSAEG